MSGIPKEIPDFGSIATMPKQVSGYVPGSSFTAEDYYVWTRCDGSTSLKQIILMVGLGVDKTVSILQRLRSEGAISVPGQAPLSRATANPAEQKAPRAPRAPTSQPITATGSQPLAESISPRNGSASGSRPVQRSQAAVSYPDVSEAADSVGSVQSIANLSAEEEAALLVPANLPEDVKRGIILARRNMANYFALLGVEPGVGKRQLKRAYFRFSKEFHPDRFFGKELGAFGPWIQEVFECSTKAINELSDSRRRKAYEARVLGIGDVGPTTQTREEHAEELFERGCANEISGDRDQALKLFAAACKINPKPPFVSRAARCALHARQLKLAEDYARTAVSLRPKDPSYARLLADVYRAANRLDEAESTILSAIELNQENDVLMAELRMDLDKVRRARGGASSREQRALKEPGHE